VNNEPIQLSDDQISILGAPNFSCAHVARLLVDGQVYAPLSPGGKAEQEQAICIHWMLGLFEEHGPTWKTEAAQRMKVIKDKIESAEREAG